MRFNHLYQRNGGLIVSDQSVAKTLAWIKEAEALVQRCLAFPDHHPVRLMANTIADEIDQKRATIQGCSSDTTKHFCSNG